jgi:hypothetical protein
MFTDDYLIPGFQLVKLHQRIILHTLIFLVLASILSILGSLISIIPIVSGFTFSGISVADLSMEQAVNLLGSDITILAGASVSFVILVLNCFIWFSFYMGGIIQEVADPKTQPIEAIKSAFNSIRLTLRPMMLIIFVGIILASIGLGLGWGIWLLSQIWILGSLIIFLGVTATLMFLFVSSLTPIISNLDKLGVTDSLKRSATVVNKDPLNYFAMFMVIVIVNTLILIIPIFGILISLITVPISIAAMAGYYHINKYKSTPTTPTTPTKSEETKPKPPLTPTETKETPSKEEKEETQETETNEERTKRILSKILKEI